MKNNFQNKQKKLVRRVALFYVFANLFKICYNRGQLDSRICFYIQSESVVLSHVM